MAHPLERSARACRRSLAAAMLYALGFAAPFDAHAQPPAREANNHAHEGPLHTDASFPATDEEESLTDIEPDANRQTEAGEEPVAREAYPAPADAIRTVDAADIDTPETHLADDAPTTDEAHDPWTAAETLWSEDPEDPDAIDPFEQFDDDFHMDWDEYTLDTIYFADPPTNFSRFNLDEARGREELASEDIQERGARTLHEAITSMTPWSPLPSTSSSPGPLLIDGLDGSWVQVLIDGIPYTRTTTGRQGPYPDLGNIPVDPRHIERIEIHRGSGPSGTCGSSGVILNLITRDPTQRYSGSISLDGGVTAQGVSRFGARADLTIPIGDDWALRARGGWNRHLELDVTGDGFYDRPRRTLDDAEVQALWRPLGEDRLTLGLRTFGAKQRTIADRRAELEDRTESRGYAFDSRYRTPAHLENRFTLRLTAQFLDHLFYKHVRRSGFNRVMSQTDAWSLRGNLTWEREFGDHAVSAELCSTLDIVSRDGAAGSTPTTRELQICAGARDVWRVSDLVTLELSALGGHHDATGARWAGGAAAVLRLNDNHGLRVSFDSGQRVPTVEERFLDFDHSELGYTLVGNEDLIAEQSFATRAGWVFKADDQRIGAEISGFVTLLRNRIEPLLVQAARPPGIPSAQYTYVNAGRGLSAGIDGVFRMNDIGGWFGFDVSYNFLPVAHDPDTKDELSLRSHHNARLSLRGSWLNNRLAVWTSAGLRSRLLWNGPQHEAPPHRASFLWDAGINGSPHESIWMGLTARNIANDIEPLWGPMPGFEVLFTIQATWDGPSR